MGAGNAVEMMIIWCHWSTALLRKLKYYCSANAGAYNIEKQASLYHLYYLNLIHHPSMRFTSCSLLIILYKAQRHFFPSNLQHMLMWGMIGVSRRSCGRVVPGWRSCSCPPPPFCAPSPGSRPKRRPLRWHPPSAGCCRGFSAVVLPCNHEDSLLNF